MLIRDYIDYYSDIDNNRKDYFDSFQRNNSNLSGQSMNGSIWIAPNAAISDEKLIITPTLGANQLLDSSCDNAAQWYLSSGWTISGGTLNASGSEAQWSVAENYTNLDTNAWYEVYSEVSNYTSGSWQYNQSPGPMSSVSILNSYRTSAASRKLGVQASSSNFNAKFDNLYAKKIDEKTMFASHNTNRSDYIAKVDFTCNLGKSSNYKGGLAVSLDNPSNPQNYIFTRFTDYALSLVKVVNGVASTLINITTGYFDGGTLELRKRGGQVALLYNNVQIGTTQSITDSTLINNVYTGVWSATSNCSFQNYSNIRN